jgi:O-antigen/teichoic acid export membrane protein
MEAPLLHTTKYQLLVALPLTAALLALAPQLVPFLFPKGGYGEAVTAFQVTSLALLFVFMNLMARYVLTAIDRQSDYLRAIVVGMVVNIVLCALLIPRYRFLGAGAAWVVAEISIFAVCQWALSPYVRFAAVLRELWRPLAASVVMGASLWWMRGLPLPLLAGLGLLIYAAALLAVRAFSPEEIRMARGLYVTLKLPGFRHLSRVEHHP